MVKSKRKICRKKTAHSKNQR